MSEYIALAKRRDGEITCASFGIGSSAHFAIALLNMMTNAKVNHVPYKGSAPSLMDLLAGQVSSNRSEMTKRAKVAREANIRAE